MLSIKNVQQRTVQHYVVLLSVQSAVKDVQNVQETVRLVQSADRLKSRMLLMTVSVLNVVPVRVPVHSRNSYRSIGGESNEIYDN